MPLLAERCSSLVWCHDLSPKLSFSQGLTCQQTAESCKTFRILHFELTCRRCLTAGLWLDTLFTSLAAHLQPSLRCLPWIRICQVFPINNCRFSACM